MLVSQKPIQSVDNTQFKNSISIGYSRSFDNFLLCFGKNFQKSCISDNFSNWIGRVLIKSFRKVPSRSILNFQITDKFVYEDKLIFVVLFTLNVSFCPFKNNLSNCFKKSKKNYKDPVVFYELPKAKKAIFYFRNGTLIRMVFKNISL